MDFWKLLPASANENRQYQRLEEYSFCFANQALMSEGMKPNDKRGAEEQLKNYDVRGECFAPHLALMLKSEWHKLSTQKSFRMCVSDTKLIDKNRQKAGL